MMMSVQSVIQSLEKLISINNYLLNISEEKTEIVTEGSVERLQALLVKERKYIRLLEQSESERKAAAEAWIITHKFPRENVTITEMLTMMDDEAEIQELEQTAIALTDTILKLKQQEQLNQDLINQSMKFVQMSLDVMSPSIQQLNYGNKNQIQAVKRSVFDSKA